MKFFSRELISIAVEIMRIEREATSTNFEEEAVCRDYFGDIREKVLIE